MAQPRIGGSFAPPLSDETIARYEELIESLPSGPVKDAMHSLLLPCKVWWELPEPNGAETARHGSGVGTMVRLQEDHARTLDEHLPWDHELDAMANLFDRLPTGLEELPAVGGEGVHPQAKDHGLKRHAVTDPHARDVRNAAFHLLWHAKELCLGREPLTNDRL
jgi:hypothetical protein